MLTAVVAIFFGTGHSGVRRMPIAKRDIVELLLARHELERAVRADEELPTLVHVEHHAWLLDELSIDPELLRDVGASSPAAGGVSR